MRSRTAAILAICVAGATVLSIVTAGGAGAGVHAKNVSRSITLDPTPADMEGSVSAQGGLQACKAQVPVAIFKFKNGAWTKVGGGKTDNTGFYQVPPGQSSGRWKAVAKAVARTNAGTSYNCLRAVSAVQTVP